MFFASASCVQCKYVKYYYFWNNLDNSSDRDLNVRITYNVSKHGLSLNKKCSEKNAKRAVPPFTTEEITVPRENGRFRKKKDLRTRSRFTTQLARADRERHWSALSRRLWIFHLLNNELNVSWWPSAWGVTVRIGGHNRVQHRDSRVGLLLEKSAEVTVALYPVESFPSAVIGDRRMNVVWGRVRSSEWRQDGVAWGRTRW